ncbi:MAG: glucose-6-phosphate isomerase [Planctomycetia bacterium]|nr:glucose-6-phosphate isomerase [Planctomycetia bacterium]
MSVIRPRPPEDPIRYDAAAVFATGGFSAADVSALAPRLEQARADALADVGRFTSGVGRGGDPLDPAFIDLPDRLLAAYHADRPTSELFAILQTARRIREAVDRVIVLGIGGSYMGTRALFEACCHPFHNELPRGERGGRPRLSFEGFNIDNDSAQGLLDVVAPAGKPRSDDLLDRWALLVVSKSGGTLETAVATRLFLAALAESVGGDRDRLASRLVPITGKTGRLADLAGAIGCPDVFDIPDGVGGRFSVLTAVGLLPASIVGIDVVRLLEGAAAMNRRFREAPVADNPVLQFVAVSHLAEERMHATIRVLSSWSNRLEATGLWYDQLLSESLGKGGQGATPLTTVTTRDLHSRGQQHQEGRRDKLITNLLVEEPRRDPLTLPPLGAFGADEDKLDDLVGRSWPAMLAAAAAGTNEAYAHDRRPTADIVLPRIDEHAVGQLLQMLMLATVVEGRLVGTNPYGQPGVEAYKSLMMKRLRP